MTDASSDPHTAATNFDDIAAHARASREERLAQEEAQWNAVRPAVESKHAIRLAAWGTDEMPVGTNIGNSILIDSAAWAPWIIDAALKWRIHPGMVVLDEKPIPDKGLGFTAGRRIFEQAARGASASDVAKAIDQARVALGRADAPGAIQNDSEDAVLTFFRQLDRFHDGVRWSPPVYRSRVIADADSLKRNLTKS